MHELDIGGGDQLVDGPRIVGVDGDPAGNGQYALPAWPARQVLDESCLRKRLRMSSGVCGGFTGPADGLRGVRGPSFSRDDGKLIATDARDQIMLTAAALHERAVSRRISSPARVRMIVVDLSCRCRR